MWVYVIDLDQNVFRVEGCGEGYEIKTQYFHLDNIPRSLFVMNEAGGEVPEDQIGIFPVMTASKDTIPAHHWADTHCTTKPNPELLVLYQTLKPEQTLSIQPAAHVPVTRRLQLQMISAFVEYFLRSFQDTFPSPTHSHFVDRQLSYAILCMARGAAMKFNSTSTPYKLVLGKVDWRIRTPTWEPPATDNYWLGGILIVIVEDIYCHSAFPAAIAKAVSLAPTTSDTTAVLFSVHSIIVVQIHPTEQGPEVSYSKTLPLFNIDAEEDPFSKEMLEALEDLGFKTPGMLALLDLFSARAPAPPSPQVWPFDLPTEICEMIFRCAEPDVQCALEQTCRLFRVIATQYPRIGEYILIKCSGEDEFIAYHGSSNSLKTVGLIELPMDLKMLREDPDNKHGVSGFEVGLWGVAEKVKLDIMLVSVEDEDEEE